MHGADIDDVEEAVDAVGGSMIDGFRTVGVGVVRAAASEIRALAADPSVDAIEADRPVRLMLDRATGATRVDEALAGFTTPKRQTVRGVDGRGVSVAIVDTGVDGTHPMFQMGGASKVVRNIKMACYDLEVDGCLESGPTEPATWIDVTDAGNDTDTGSGGGHGTHVAGIAAGVGVTTSNGARLHGAAPGAKVVGVSMGLTLRVTTAAASLNWVLEHHRAPCGADVDAKSCPPIKVVNNSWSVTLPGQPHDPNRAIVKLENALADAGVTVVWAAGNSGGTGGDETTSSDANSPRGGILSVANYDDMDSGSRNHVLAPSSSRGERGSPQTYPDLAAPGTNILSSCRPTLPVCRLGASIDPDYATISGTSMAAPHVVGIVALLLHANPKLTPAQIEDVLEDTAHPITFGASYERDPLNRGAMTSYDKGHGLIDAASAVANVKRVPAPTAVRECTGRGPLMVDPSGDADAVSQGIPGTTDADLDIVEADAAWDGGSFRMRVRFASTGAGFPAASQLVFSFGYARRDYTALATRDVLGSWSYSLSEPDGTVLDVPVRGSYDAERKEIVLGWSTSAFNAATATPAPPLPPMRRGSFVGPFQVVALRGLAAGLTSSDHVASACFVQMGAGPHVRPAIWEHLPVPVHATVSRNRAYSWTAPAATGSAPPVTGIGLPNWVGAGPGSSERFVRVLPSGKIDSLHVSLVLDDPRLSDFDVSVYGSDGTLVGYASNTFDDVELWVEDVTTGVYTIVVAPYAAVLGTYRATAELSV